jgi:hypothetical protein
MPLLTFSAIEAHKPRAQPYKLTLDRGLQLRIAADGARTLRSHHRDDATQGFTGAALQASEHLARAFDAGVGFA